MATDAERLDEAKKALDALITGRSVVEVHDSDGSRIVFSRTKVSDLRAYIAELQNLVTPPSPCATGPMRVYF